MAKTLENAAAMQWPEGVNDVRKSVTSNEKGKMPMPAKCPRKNYAQ
jgi:hypothetical protein